MPRFRPNRSLLLALPFVVAAALLPAGCGSSTPAPKASNSQQTTHKPHIHPEAGPNGGPLAEVGEEDAHLEIMLNAEGKLTVFVLDRDAKQAVPIKAGDLELTFVLGHGDDGANGDKAKDDVTGTVTLKAVEPDANGMSARFSGESPLLKGAHAFRGHIPAITIGEKTFKDITFEYAAHDH
jgi:hypothetical protein